MLTLACAINLLTAACDRMSASRPSGPSVRLQFSAAPKFTDWRAAYLGRDGHLHSVTLDGKTDIVGPPLSGMAINGLDLASAGVSPNGHLLAYVGADGLVVLDVTGRLNTSRIPNMDAPEVVWSPDESQLALGDGQGGVSLVRIADGQLRIMPGPRPQGLTDIVGWIDNTHLAVRIVTITGAAQSSSSVSLGVLETSSWQVRTVGTINSSSLGAARFVLSPDGAYALCFNKRFRDDPYSPIVDEINIATGKVTPLPHIAQSMGPYSGFTSLAWRPGTQTVVASTGFDVNNDLKVWLLDLQRDTAEKQPVVRYVAGWAPDNGPLVLSTGWENLTNQGPYKIDAATFGTGGIVAMKTLTRAAMTFPFLGFVSTA